MEREIENPLELLTRTCVGGDFPDILIETGIIQKEGDIRSIRRLPFRVIEKVTSSIPPQETRTYFPPLARNEEITKAPRGPERREFIVINHLATTPEEKLRPLELELKTLLPKDSEASLPKAFKLLLEPYMNSCNKPPSDQEEFVLAICQNQKSEEATRALLEVPSVLKHLKGEWLLQFIKYQSEKGEEFLDKFPPGLLCNVGGFVGRIARSLSEDHLQAYIERLIEMAIRGEAIFSADQVEERTQFFLNNLDADLLDSFRIYLLNNRSSEPLLFFLHLTFEGLYKKLQEQGKDAEEIAGKIKEVLCEILKKEKEEVEAEKGEEAQAILEATAGDQPATEEEPPPTDKKGVPLPPPPEEAIPLGPPTVTVPSPEFKPEPPPEPPAPLPEPEQKICPDCKKENHPGANFCARCGSNLRKSKPALEDEEDDTLRRIFPPKGGSPPE